MFGGSGGEGVLCAVWDGLVPGGKGKGLGLVIFDLVSVRTLNFIFYSQVPDGNSQSCIRPVLEHC